MVVPDGFLDCNAYLDELDKLRRIRNEIMHGNRPADDNEARRAIDAALGSIWNLFRFAKIDYNSYRNAIIP